MGIANANKSLPHPDMRRPMMVSDNSNNAKELQPGLHVAGKIRGGKTLC